jgi:uncharacterized protein YegL
MSTFVDNHLVNHVVFVLDESTSMNGARAQQLVSATAAEVKYLAQRSGSSELNQETRVAIYTFADRAQCVVPERDVMRLPEIKDIYHPKGNTALVDATLLTLDDIALVCQKYGNHAFLVYVLTDGEENASSYASRAALPKRLASLPDNVTVACLVPEGQNYRGTSCRDDAVKLGFPSGNVAVWNTDSSDGVQVAVQSTMRVATNNYMTARASGLRSTTTLFSTSSAADNDTAVKQALEPLSTDEYTLIPIVPPPASNNGKPWEIKLFAEHCGHKYTAGYSGYYELVATKKKPSEIIQGNKKIIVVEKATNQAFGGDAARGLLKLTDKTERVRPKDYPGYKIYVLSGSVNRHLVPGTHLLIKK